MRAPASQPELVERDGELAALKQALAAAREGRGSLVALEGPAGIGKTRLMEELRGTAERDGVRVLVARGGELETGFAFGVVRQLLEPPLAEAGPERRAELLEGPASLATALVEGDPAAATAGGEPEAFALLHGLFWLVANLAGEEPLLVAVDDAHWCDGESLRWLAYLAQRVEGLPVLVALAWREVESPELRHMLATIAAADAAAVSRPRPLSDAATAELIRARVSPDADQEFCAACHAASGGNPLLLRELSRALTEEDVAPSAANAGRVLEIGADAVAIAVKLRLGRLSAAAQRLAEAAAVLGDGGDLGAAGALAGLGDAEAREAVAELARADILGEQPAFGFTHPLVRAAVLGLLPPGSAAQAHARAAELLERRGASAEAIAAHVAAAPPRGDAQAVRTLRAAARGALAAGGAEAAVSYLRRALDEPPPAEERAAVLYELGTAEQRLHGPSAVEHLREALALETGQPWVGEAALTLGRTLTFTDSADAAAEVFEEAIAARADPRDDVGLRLEAGLLLLAVTETRLAGVRDRLLETIRADGPPPGRAGRLMLATLAFHDARAGGSLDEAVERSREALAGGTLVEESDAACFVMPALILMAADRVEETRGLWDEVLDQAAARGSVFAFATASCFRAHALALLGRLPDAQADAQAALESGLAHGIEAGIPWITSYLVDVLLERDEPGEAEAVLAESDIGRDPPDTAHFHSFLLSRARLHLVRGRDEDALADALEAGRRYGVAGGINPGMLAWRSTAAAALLRLERREEAERLAAEELELARAWGAPRAVATALLQVGLTRAGRRGETVLREAVAALAGSRELRVDRARTQLALGQAIRRRGQRTEAREPLREAFALAHECGALAIERVAREELLASGARPRRAAISGRDALTPSERRVAALAADGQTNRAIAQNLFVAPKTVEVHLSNVYRKLDLRSRTQLAGALGG